jgi:hypothetical protein
MSSTTPHMKPEHIGLAAAFFISMLLLAAGLTMSNPQASIPALFGALLVTGITITIVVEGLEEEATA